MNSRFPIFLTLWLSTVLASSADAQQWKKPSESENRKQLLSVTDFNPKSGKIGTEISIQGQGFSARTKLLVGGRPVRPTRVQASLLVFKIPANHGDGAIVLRHPGVARDIRVGQLAIATTAQITGFVPQSGVRGTRIQISGSGFKRGDRVLMNGKEITVNRSAPKRLVVTIPMDATTDHLTLVAKDGGLVRTKTTFQVKLPAPAITSFAPASGFPGTTVRLMGTNFTAEDKILFGKKRLNITNRGADFVEVTIPQKTRKSAVLILKNPNGETRTATPFKIEKPAVVKSISPDSGKAGQSVSIKGNGFRAGDSVTMNGATLDIVQLRPTQITVQIPKYATSGLLVVERGSMKAASPRSFEIVRAPVVLGFSPEGGRPGARVTITGQYFTRDSQVYYGAKKLRVIKRKGDTTLMVKLPPRSAAQVLRVRNKGGEAHAAKPFEIRLPAVVASVTPTEGFAGTRITLRGKHMRSVEQIRLGKTPLTIESHAPDHVVASIPPNATSGRLAILTIGKQRLSRLRFKVLPGPRIDLITPQSGTPGVEIVIEGENLFPQTKVFLGQVELPVKSRTKGRLVARVPTKMPAGNHSLRLRSGASEARAQEQFKVVAPAEITSFRPDRVDAGAKIQLLGTNFDMSTKVFWGPVLLQVIHVGPRGNSMTVRIPPNTIGARYLIVDSGGLRAQSRDMLEVVTPRRGKRR